MLPCCFDQVVVWFAIKVCVCNQCSLQVPALCMAAQPDALPHDGLAVCGRECVWWGAKRVGFC